jgi:hypothetical protein
LCTLNNTIEKIVDEILIYAVCNHLEEKVEYVLKIIEDDEERINIRVRWGIEFEAFNNGVEFAKGPQQYLENALGKKKKTEEMIDKALIMAVKHFNGCAVILNLLLTAREKNEVIIYDALFLTCNNSQTINTQLLKIKEKNEAVFNELLTLAVKKGVLSIIKVLVETNQYSETGIDYAIKAAAESKNFEILLILLKTKRYSSDIIKEISFKIDLTEYGVIALKIDFNDISFNYLIAYKNNIKFLLLPTIEWSYLHKAIALDEKWIAQNAYIQKVLRGYVLEINSDPDTPINQILLEYTEQSSYVYEHIHLTIRNLNAPENQIQEMISEETNDNQNPELLDTNSHDYTSALNQTKM